jgi:NIMA (never in mitosis gene a)-related kinase
LGFGVFGIVELIRYQKKLYAHKKPRQNTSEQRISILEEGIKLTDIAQHHPNIQRLNFINLRTFGLIIDYCSNGSLDGFVREKISNYSLVDVLNWSYQLADALSFLHSKKIIHRDVKMQNILLKDNYQTLVLTDYGTATQLGKSWMTDNVGTPITMAPEVFAYNQYAEQCDTYSWAIVFWQLISKQLLPYGNQGKGLFK